jgi:cobalt-zinc-cadmium efflux system outer membrane protein
MRRSIMVMAVLVMVSELELARAQGDVAAVVEDEPSGVLSRDAALGAALRRSPELGESGWELRAAEARVLEAERRPDPSVALVVEDALGTGSYWGGGQAQTTLEVNQVFELGGKRAARVDVAEHARGLANAERELKRIDVTAEVGRRFIRLLVAQQGADLAADNTARAERTLAAARRRVRAGADSALEEQRAAVAVERARIAGEHAEHLLAVARREMAATWGAVEARFERAAGDLFARRPVPAFDVLADALATAPEVDRNARERRLRDAELRLVAARRVPNVTIGGGLRRLEGPGVETFVFSVGVPLPFSNRNLGAIREAEALVGRADATRRTIAVRMRTALFGLYQELQHAGIELDGLERNVLPRARDAVGMSRNGFEEGRFSYLDLLEAERTLADVQRERIDVAGSYQLFLVEMERLIGAPIAGAGEGIR